MAKIEKNMIEALLARPTSKQVLAFEGVFLEDLNDYVKWAIDSLHNSLGEEMDEALLLLSSHLESFQLIILSCRTISEHLPQPPE